MGRGVHQLVEFEQHVDVVARAVARGQLVHALDHQRGADPARRAETAALVGEEMREAARHLEHVAAAVEHHEGAGGGHVLEGDAPAELEGRQADARRPADLHRLRVAARRSPPGCGPMRVPNGYSYRPGRSQSPDTEWILVPVDLGVPMPAHQAPPCSAMWAAAQKVSTLLTMVG